MFVGLEGYSNEMVAVCVLISIVAAFSYVYRKRVKSAYKGIDLRNGGNAATVKAKPKKQINPQGTKNDYLQMLSAIVSLSRKKKWLIIAPAVIEAGGSYTQMVALIVTPKKIIGVCAFGHGGTITAAPGMQEWTQNINDTENKIQSPLKSMANAETILKKVYRKLEIEGRELEVLGGYTHPHAKLQGAPLRTCYNSFDLLVQLQMEDADPKGDNEQSKEIAEKLRTVVLKPEKQQKGAKK